MKFVIILLLGSILGYCQGFYECNTCVKKCYNQCCNQADYQQIPSCSIIKSQGIDKTVDSVPKIAKSMFYTLRVCVTECVRKFRAIEPKHSRSLEPNCKLEYINGRPVAKTCSLNSKSNYLTFRGATKWIRTSDNCYTEFRNGIKHRTLCKNNPVNAINYEDNYLTRLVNDDDNYS